MICLVLTIFANIFPSAWTGLNERTFLAIKPDGFQRRLVGEIIRRFEKKGFKLVGLKLVQVSPAGSGPPRQRPRAAVFPGLCASAPPPFLGPHPGGCPGIQRLWAEPPLSTGLRGPAAGALLGAAGPAFLQPFGQVYELWPRGCHGEDGRAGVGPSAWWRRRLPLWRGCGWSLLGTLVTRAPGLFFLEGVAGAGCSALFSGAHRSHQPC
ncbi:nucleoside diphosphate kinase 3 isoform X1 [Monodelphis domestica]|uniref:nucleoside diphosphate kinase 3 isoform X1 n=1 Tax=Monodelphis domestica TaxID=13616 RepID=UPI0024E19D4D|nr:nucleoside diphosphate kinase 3 isoform X1 [Monodelphis domestica]